MSKKIDQLIKDKNNAYWERNQLVVVLSKLFPSYLTKHPETDQNWDSDWRTIVVINIPVQIYDVCGKELRGVTEFYQFTWHIHDSEVALFDHLNYQDNKWDGHTTEEKYKRLRQISIKEALNYFRDKSND